ncbi:MAG: hypothetical protein U0X76_07700 [Bacteroidia bacterium]
MKILNRKEIAVISRVTVDTPEDFSLIKELIEKYHAETLSCRAIEDILLEHPELQKSILT